MSSGGSLSLWEFQLMLISWLLLPALSVRDCAIRRAPKHPLTRFLKLSQHWAEGMRTKHGMHVHGFPNAFIVQPTQGANLISNVPHNLTEGGKTIAAIVRHALDVRAREV